MIFYPKSGKNRELAKKRCMLWKMDQTEFKRYVVGSYGMTEGAFDKLYEEFLACFGQTLEEYVAVRHTALQRAGRKNAEIYRLIGEETRGMRFAAPPLTERQIRRLIYG